jgi:hypothetical protein
VTTAAAPDREPRELPATDQAARRGGPRPLPRHMALPPGPAGAREDAHEPGKAGQRP